MSNTEIIEDRINHLWAGTVTNFNFDVAKHEVTFHVHILDNDKKEDFDVTISEISFYLSYDEYELKCQGDESASDEWAYTELSMFFYMPSGDASWPPNSPFDIDYNLELEFWCNQVLIKANKLKINDEEFQLS